MRLGFKGSRGRSILVAVMVLALGLIVVPSAMASMILGGVTEGKWAGGVRELSATVSVFADKTLTPATATTDDVVFTTSSSESGMWLMAVQLADNPLDKTYYSDWPVFGEAPGFTTAQGSFEFLPDGAGVASDLQLVVKNTVFKGTVIDKATNRGLKNVKVIVVKRTFLTKAKGRYSVSIGLWPGAKYTIKYMKKGYKTATRTVVGTPDNAATPINIKKVKLVRR